MYSDRAWTCSIHRSANLAFKSALDIFLGVRDLERNLVAGKGQRLDHVREVVAGDMPVSSWAR